MSDERIDIEVTDKVDANVEKKLRGIAAAADKGESSVAKLKAQLAAINLGPVQQLQQATATVTQTINTELNATKKLREEMDAASAADLKATSAKDKLTEASKRATAAAQAETSAKERLAAVVDKTVARSTGTAALNVGTAASTLGGVGGSRATAAAQTAAMSAGAGAAAAAVRDVEKATEELASKTPGLFARVKTSALGAFDTFRDFTSGNGSRFRGVAKEVETGVASLGSTLARATPHVAANSTAIRELLVIAREGGRGDFTRMAGSVSILAQALGLMNVLLPIAIVGAIGLFSATKTFNSEANQNKLKDYANSLGLTEKEMRKLENTTVGANGKIHEFNNIKITLGDTFNGFVATVIEGLSSFFAPFAGVQDAFSSGWDKAVGFARNVFIGFYGLVKGLLETIGGILANVIITIGNTARLIANSVAMVIQDTLNIAIGGINLLVRGANAVAGVFGTKLAPELDKVDFGIKSVTQGFDKFVKVDIAGSVVKNIKEADRTLKTFSKRWEDNTVSAAEKRMKTAADAIIANRNPKAPKKVADPKTQDDFLDDENAKLDNQLSRMKLLKDAREEQAQLDAIEESFLKRRMPLDAAQLEGFRARIHAIQMFKYQQAEMDRIVEAADGPQRTYNASIAAATDLLGRGAINQEKFAQETLRATRALAEATDPLFAMKEAMDQTERATGLYGDAVQKNNYYEQIRAAYLAKNIDITKNSTQAIKDEVAALMARNDANMQKTYVAGKVGDVVNPILEDAKFLANKQSFFDEIDRLRQTDVISERQAQQAKAGIQSKYDQIRLAGASSFFENLSSLSQSKNKELAAIGKAAAIVDATIKGYQAVQNAYAEVPYPFNIAAAAAMAVATGVQVANIASQNVGSFATGGQFMVDGRSGVDANNINMNVTNGERVTIETPAQQRENDSKGGGNSPINLKVVNVTDKKDMHAAMADADGERTILNVIRRNPKTVKALVG